VAIELGRKEPVRQTLLSQLRRPRALPSRRRPCQIYGLKKSRLAGVARFICNVLILPPSTKAPLLAVAPGPSLDQERSHPTIWIRGPAGGASVHRGEPLPCRHYYHVAFMIYNEERRPRESMPSSLEACWSFRRDLLLIRVHTNRAIFLQRIHGLRESESSGGGRSSGLEDADWKFLLAEHCADKGDIYPTRELLVSSLKRG